MLKNIVQLFVDAAEKYPDHIAIIDKNNRQITYLDMLDAVKNKAAEIRSSGIRKGDRVLVFVPVSIDLYINVLAVLYCGASVVFIDEWTDFKRLKTCCRIAACRAIILPSSFRWLKWLLAPLREIPLRIDSKIKRAAGVFDAEETDIESHTALITFSSGTTGIPKAADRTHRILLEQFKALEKIRNAVPGEANLTTLPIVLLLNLASGCTSVIANYKPRKPLTFTPEKIIQQIVDHTITSLTLSPFFSLMLAGNNELSQIKRLVIGGACMFPEDIQTVKKGFPSAEILLVYGSTEAEPIAVTTADEFLKTPYPPQDGLYVGRSVAGIETLIHPPGNNTGELCVSGPHVLKNYFNDTGSSAKHFFYNEKLWLRTGDFVTISKENVIFLLGRHGHIYRQGKKRNFPVVIEMLARSCRGVQFAALLNSNTSSTLFLEASNNFIPGELSALLKKNGYEGVKIKVIKSIPHDKRHFSRPDYEKLKRLLKPEERK